MSDPKIETSLSEAVTSEDVERQIRALRDPLIQQLAHLCERLTELRHAHAHRRQEETASWRATSSSTGGTSRSEMVTETFNPASRHLAHSGQPHDSTLQNYQDIKEYSVLMTTKNPLQTPRQWWFRWWALSTASPPSSSVMSTRLKCYIHKCPISEALKTNSTNSSFYSSTTCNLISTELRKRTNYTNFKISWEMKPSSFAKHWR